MRVFWILLSCFSFSICSNIAQGALHFDGKSGQVRIPDLRCRGESPLTVEFIVTPNMPVDGYGRIVSNISYHNGERHGFAVGISKGYWLVCIETERGWRRLRSDHPAVNGARVHFAVVFNQDLVTLFVNGQKNESTIKLTHKMDISDQDFLLGCERETKGRIAYRFAGDLEAIRFSSTPRYERKFTPPEQLETDEKTLLHYNFDENPGETSKDLSGLDFDGVVSDVKWIAPAPNRTYPDIEDLQKTIGLYEAQRTIKGGGTLKDVFYVFTSEFEVQENGKKIGIWSIPDRNKLIVSVTDDRLGPIELALKTDGTLVGSQEKDGREVEWSFQRLRIESHWHHTRKKGDRLLSKREFLLFSNGKLGSHNSTWTWEMRGNSLYYHWNQDSTFRMSLSRDGQIYRGKNPSGDSLRGVRLD